MQTFVEYMLTESLNKEKTTRTTIDLPDKEDVEVEVMFDFDDDDESVGYHGKGVIVNQVKRLDTKQPLNFKTLDKSAQNHIEQACADKLDIDHEKSQPDRKDH